MEIISCAEARAHGDAEHHVPDLAHRRPDEHQLEAVLEHGLHGAVQQCERADPCRGVHDGLLREEPRRVRGLRVHAPEDDTGRELLHRGEENLKSDR